MSVQEKVWQAESQEHIRKVCVLHDGEHILQSCSSVVPVRWHSPTVGSRKQDITGPFRCDCLRSGYRLHSPREWPGTYCIGGWVAPGSVWTVAENPSSTGIRSPDCPSRSQSSYQLSYSGPHRISSWDSFCFLSGTNWGHTCNLVQRVNNTHKMPKLRAVV
jgi:hypothetical protein